MTNSSEEITRTRRILASHITIQTAIYDFINIVCAHLRLVLFYSRFTIVEERKKMKIHIK